jgi:hypothetical protein
VPPFATSPEERTHATTVAGRPFTIPRHLRRNRLVGRWVAAWLGATTLGLANAAVRQLVYADRVEELAAHQISTVTLLGALTYYIWLLDQRWPLPTTRAAVAIGGSWAALTVLFEVGLGRYVLGSSWSDLFANYNLAAGRIWVLVPVWMALEPAVLQRLRANRS